LILAALLIPASVFAEDKQFENGEVVRLRPDRGYVLVRTFQTHDGGLRGTAMYTPVFVRVLSDDELKQAQAFAASDPDHWKEKVSPNVVEPLASHPYGTEKDMEFLLTSLSPGTYVLAGFAVTNWALVDSGVLITSLCMGTVKFEVKPGVVTDLGALLGARDDLPTGIPQLAHVVTGKPIGEGGVPYTLVLQPDALDVPAGLATLPRVPADYRAVGAFPNYLGAPLSRLTPVAGVLAYDKDGAVVDLKALQN